MLLGERMANEPEVVVFPSLEAAQTELAKRLVELSETIVGSRGRLLLALSGGSGPPGVFRQLTAEPLRSRMPWSQISVIWVDERFVPFDSPDSNYLLARQTLLDHVPIPSQQVYPVPTYYATAQEAAALYDRQVRALLVGDDAQIDIALLGMGPDGHTASLFPGHAALDAPPEALALAVEGAPKPPPTRITLSAGALNRVAHAFFLVTGADKADAVRAALRGPNDPQRTPAQLVRPPRGHLVWLLDQAAASKLSD